MICLSSGQDIISLNLHEYLQYRSRNTLIQSATCSQRGQNWDAMFIHRQLIVSALLLPETPSQHKHIHMQSWHQCCWLSVCIVVSRGASPKSLRFWELPWYLTLRLTHLFEKNPFSPLRNLSSSFTESPEGRRWHDARVGGLHCIHQDGAWPRGGRMQTEFAGHVLCSHW